MSQGSSQGKCVGMSLKTQALWNPQGLKTPPPPPDTELCACGLGRPHFQSRREYQTHRTLCVSQ